MRCDSCGGLNAALRCSRCRGAVYCNASCQRAAWSEHKKGCKPLVVGDKIRTIIELKPDVDGAQLLKKGAEGHITVLPAENDGHTYEVDIIGDQLWDIHPSELERWRPLAPPQQPTPARASRHSAVEPTVVSEPVGSPETDSQYPTAESLWVQGARAYFGAVETSNRELMELAMVSFRDSLKITESREGVEKDPESFAKRAHFLGVSLLDGGRDTEGLHLLRQAVAHGPQLRAGHLDLCLALEEAGDLAGARQAAKTAVEAGFLKSPWQRPGSFCKGLRSEAWWKTGEFKWVQQLEAKFPEIREEYDSLLERDFGTVGGEHRSVGRSDGNVLAEGAWTEVVLFGNGAVPSAAPKTVALLRDLIPECVDLCATGGGEVVLSRMAPGTKVATHCAPTNYRLTCHLGIEIPECNGAKIRVGDEWRGWEEGKCIIFDDSFEHEVHNNSLKTRTVLLIRFWHPDIVDRSKAVADGELEFADLTHRRRSPYLGDVVDRRLSGNEVCEKCGGKQWGLVFEEGRALAICQRC